MGTRVVVCGIRLVCKVLLLHLQNAVVSDYPCVARGWGTVKPSKCLLAESDMRVTHYVLQSDSLCFAIRPQRPSSSNVLSPDMNCLNHLKTVALDRD